MTFKAILFATTASVMLLGACKEEPEAAANRLFVEAAGAISQYRALNASDESKINERKDLIDTAVDNLKQILTEYPSTSVAVRIVSAEKSSEIYLPALQEVQKEIDQDVLCRKETSAAMCRLDDALIGDIARLRSDDYTRSAAIAIVLSGVGRFEEAKAFLDKTSDRYVAWRAGLSMFVFGLAYGDTSVADYIIGIYHLDDYEERKTLMSIISKQVEIAKSPITDFQETGEIEVDMNQRLRRAFIFLAKGESESAKTEISEAYLLTTGSSDQISFASQDEICSEFVSFVGEELSRWLDTALMEREDTASSGPPTPAQ